MTALLKLPSASPGMPTAGLRRSVLEEHPVLLVRALGGGQGRWVIPQKALGAEYEPDFIIGEKSSLGYEWTLGKF
jgi:hypothetical protein